MHHPASCVARRVGVGFWLPIVLGVLASTLFIAPTPALAIDYRLNIITSTFATRIGERLIINVATPTLTDVQTMLTDARTSGVVSLSTPIVRRQTVTDIVAGGDFVPQATTSVRGPVFRAVDLNGRPAFQLTVATSATRRPGTVQISDDGLRALRLTVTSATGLIAQITTFINVVSSRTYTTLPVSIVASIDAPPTLQPDGSVVIDDATREQLEDFRNLLARKPPDRPIAVRVRPELLNGLARSTNSADQVLLTELLAQLATNDVLVSTFRPTDVAAYAAVGLKAPFEAQLLRGESILDAANGPTLIERAVWLTNDALDSASIDFLRDFGVTNVIAVGDSVSRYGADIDPTRAYALRSPTKGLVLHLADARYSTLLDNPTGTAYESATAIAAELIAQRNELANSQIGAAALSGRHVVVASASGVPSEPLIGAILIRHLRNSPQVSLRRVGDFTPSLEGLARITPPVVPLVDVAAIQSRTADALNAVNLVTDVLVTNDGLTQRWIELVDVANDTTLTEARRNDYLDAVLTQAGAVRNAVKLPTTSFTFGGRDSELRLALTNTTPFKVSLRLQIASPTGKMTFVPSEFDIVIAPNGQQEVTVAASARTNGLIPLELVLQSPTGTILDVAQLRVRVNAIAGLGRGVSAVFLVLLLVWWLIHTRRHHKQHNTKKHPALRSQS
jgi:hypothetical protein